MKTKAHTMTSATQMMAPQRQTTDELRQLKQEVNKTEVQEQYPKIIYKHDLRNKQEKNKKIENRLSN